MEVTFIGNMNNNLYSLSKLLRFEGVKTKLLLYPNEKFFPWEEDENAKKYNWIKKINWGDNGTSYFLTKKSKIISDIEGDILVGCGLSPLLVSKVRVAQPFFFFPYGSDLYEIPWCYKKTNLIKKPFYFLISILQRKGIKYSKGIFLYQNGIIYNNANKKLNSEHLIIPYGIPVDLSKFSKKNLNNSILSFLDTQRKYFDYIIFSPTRHTWYNPFDEIDRKGNDILIKGFAKYIKNTKFNPLLILISHGCDVKKSKELIKKLKIEKNIIWIKRTSRNILRTYYYGCDIVADQFNFPNGGYGLIALEAWAYSKPLITHISKFVNKNCKKLYYLEANTPDEIKDKLLLFEKNPEHVLDIGKKAYMYVKEKHGKKLIKKYKKLFKSIL